MTASAAAVVAALARLHRKLTDVATTLRGRPGVTAVTTDITPREYPSGDRVECYVDAGLTSGNTVGIWLEFRWESGSWVVESSIRRNTDEGEDELVGQPTRYAVGDDELAIELDGAVGALAESVETLDLEVL